MTSINISGQINREEINEPIQHQLAEIWIEDYIVCLLHYSLTIIWRMGN